MLLNPMTQTTQKHKFKNSGLTILETILTITIGVTAAVFMTLTAIAGIKSIRDEKKSERLHANATHIVETVTYLVKQGKIISVPNASTLTVTLPDFSTKTVTLSGNRLTVDGEAITSNDIKLSEITFIKLARSVQMAFTLTTQDGQKIFSATTTVAERNTL